MPRSFEALSVEQAEKAAGELGYPVVVRPAYTLGGTGGGVVYNNEELQTIASRGIQASMIDRFSSRKAFLAGRNSRSK